MKPENVKLTPPAGADKVVFAGHAWPVEEGGFIRVDPRFAEHLCAHGGCKPFVEPVPAADKASKK